MGERVRESAAGVYVCERERARASEREREREMEGEREREKERKCVDVWWCLVFGIRTITGLHLHLGKKSAFLIVDTPLC